MNYCIWMNLQQNVYIKQNITQGQFLTRVKLVCIQNFPSPRLVALPRLKNTVYENSMKDYFI